MTTSPMDELLSQSVPDQDITKVLDSAAPRPSLPAAPAEAPIEEAPLAEAPPAARLPPMSPPPLRPPTVPPVAIHSIASTPMAFPTPAPPNRASFEVMRPASSKASAEYEALVARRAIAVGCIVAACAFTTIALIFAFRMPPSLGTMPPLVAAMVVFANAVLAIGSGAFGYGLLRMAERLSVVPPGAPLAERRSQPQLS